MVEQLRGVFRKVAVKGLIAYQASPARKGQVAVGSDVLVVRIVKRPLLALLGEIAVVSIPSGDIAAQQVFDVVIRGAVKNDLLKILHPEIRQHVHVIIGHPVVAQVVDVAAGFRMAPVARGQNAAFTVPVNGKNQVRKIAHRRAAD